MNKTIAIFCAGQWGDCGTISSVLKYRNELWGDCKLVWYIAKENMDLLKFQDIEVREFPRGFGYPEMVYEENKKLVDIGKEPIWEDWKPLVDERNHMNLELKKNYPSLADIDYGYFPAPHQMSSNQRHGLDYPRCSKKVFSIPEEWEWHPVISHSTEEIEMVEDFINSLPEGKRILFETFAGSDQSKLSHEMICSAIKLCKEKWPKCNMIFASHKYLRAQEEFPENFFEQEGIYSCANFTVRQCALVSDYCNLILSVSSGIMVACSSWGRVNVPVEQFCGSWVCSTISLAKGRHFELVTADNKILQTAQTEFMVRLESLLNQYK